MPTVSAFNIGKLNFEIVPSGEKFQLIVRGSLYGLEIEVSADELRGLVQFIERQLKETAR